MAFDAVTTGSVIGYPYLWRREALAGETAGRKERPVAVAVRLVRPAGDQLILLAITTRQPSGGAGVEIPWPEKQRAGLNVDKRLWIVVSECNFDVVGLSFHLSPSAPLGRFSGSYMKVLREALAQAGGLSLSVSRLE
ncbi:hypothetical protein [Marinicauda sp. Alg238-R41]|uniref:hypothetical protein n=1 Tax=Marinicauda sp. Alg238-R41 TaxID=2993447 RepID=UPI0022E0A096|nr:hypothetical protein [Marinicauda sp. Alg238-R41]